MKLFDNTFRTDGIKLIAGVDEAGRGPLAGPVVAAAVIFPADYFNEEINDSKKLSHDEREKCYDEIISNALSCAYHFISPEEIDNINILQASLKAMGMAVKKLTLKPDLILVDGNKIFYSETPIKCIVKGDSKSLSIAAASIIAKVIRDRYMKTIAANYPIYSWEKNKGYPTQLHREKILKYGVTPHHRKTFLKKLFFEQHGIFAQEER